MSISSQSIISRCLVALVPIAIASLVLIAVTAYLASAAQETVAAGTCCNETAEISNVTISDVTSTTAVISWQTQPPAATCLYLDSDIHQVFPSPQPISRAFQGVAYAPGEYNAYLNCVDRDLVTATIISDVEAIAAANFNAIVLYSVGPSDGAIHPWDQIVFDTAAAQDLKIVFRLEWYPSSSFDWGPEDSDAILSHYDAYLSYFKTNPDHLLYFLINMPLDDPSVPAATIGQQRDYIAYFWDGSLGCDK